MLFFKEYSYEMYGTLPLSMRMMNDFMNGNYNRSTSFGREEDQYIVFTTFHLLMSKVLLINYVIALLMTVYNSMREKGDFAYKSNRYEYIERYQIALRDGWGFSELVTIPAPLSISLVLILPWVFNKPAFKNAADMVGKMFFWIENLAYLLILIIYSLFLCPLIYAKFLISTWKNTTVLPFILYSFLWIPLGVFYLAFLLLVDIFNFIRILSDYQDDDASQETKIKYEHLQDK